MPEETIRGQITGSSPGQISTHKRIAVRESEQAWKKQPTTELHKLPGPIKNGAILAAVSIFFYFFSPLAESFCCAANIPWVPNSINAFINAFSPPPLIVPLSFCILQAWMSVNAFQIHFRDTHVCFFFLYIRYNGATKIQQLYSRKKEKKVLQIGPERHN